MNKKADLFKMLPLLMIIPVIIFFSLMIWIMTSSLSISKECNKLDECESYKCIQDKGISIFEQNNAALKYQNCLLEEERPQKNLNPYRERTITVLENSSAELPKT